MAQLPVESDFKVDVFADRVAVHLGPTRSIYTFARFVGAREIAEFGPISPDPVIQHGSRIGGTRNYDAAEVLAMAFRLAAGAVRRGCAEPAARPCLCCRRFLPGALPPTRGATVRVGPDRVNVGISRCSGHWHGRRGDGVGLPPTRSNFRVAIRYCRGALCGWMGLPAELRLSESLEKFSVAVVAMDDGRFAYQVFLVCGEPRTLLTDSARYLTPDDAAQAGYEAVASMSETPVRRPYAPSSLRRKTRHG
jgi:hypothetical protein